MPILPEIEALLADDAWIRRIAGRLVTDPHLADDLAQDAWVVALGSAGAGQLQRPWLGGVLRTLVRTGRRSDRRRKWREGLAARDEALPSTSEIIEKVTLRREVVNVLLELDEPYRSTLYLRFFLDLTPKAIAGRTGVPPSTVHDRVRRGLELMRARLDRAHDGDRRAWSLAMLPLAKRAGGLLSAVKGGILMSTGFKLASSTIVVAGALGVGVWFRAHASDARIAEPTHRAERVVAPGELAELDGTDLMPPAGEGARVEVDSEAAAQAAPQPVSDSVTKTLVLTGRVIDTLQRPVANLGIGFQLSGESEAQVSTTTDGSGRFSMERAAPPPSDLSPLFAKLNGGALVVEGSYYRSVVVGSMEDGLVVVVAPRADVSGRVIDVSGDRIAGARVAVRVSQELYRNIGLTQFSSPEQSWEMRTDASGEFTIEDACGGEHLFLDVLHFGYVPKQEALAEPDLHDLLVVLERVEDAIEVTGRVIDEHGEPVERAAVSMGESYVGTDREGLVSLSWDPRQASKFTNFLGEPMGAGGAGGAGAEGPLHIAAIKPGYAPAWVDLEELDLAAPILLRLGSQPLSISGRVRDESGEPLGGVIVWATDLTHFGKYMLREGEDSTTLTLTLEEGIRGKRGKIGTASEDDGSFELDGLMARTYHVAFYDPTTACYGRAQTIEAGRGGVDLVLERAPSVERVAGRIVSAEGTPVSGVGIHVMRASGIGDGATHSEPPERLIEDRILDEHGDMLTCVVSYGSLGNTITQFLKFEDDGRTRVLRVPETAHTLVLRKAGDEITRLPLKVNLDRRTVVRY